MRVDDFVAAGVEDRIGDKAGHAAERSHQDLRHGGGQVAFADAVESHVVQFRPGDARIAGQFVGGQRAEAVDGNGIGLLVLHHLFNRQVEAHAVKDLLGRRFHHAQRAAGELVRRLLRLLHVHGRERVLEFRAGDELESGAEVIVIGSRTLFAPGGRGRAHQHLAGP